MQLNVLDFFFGRRPLPFGDHLRLTRGPAGNRTTTGSLSAYAIERVGRPGGSHEGVGRKKTPPSLPLLLLLLSREAPVLTLVSSLFSL